MTNPRNMSVNRLVRSASRTARIAHRQANGVFAGSFQFLGLLIGLDRNGLRLPPGCGNDIGGLLLCRGDERLGLIAPLCDPLIAQPSVMRDLDSGGLDHQPGRLGGVTWGAVAVPTPT